MTTCPTPDKKRYATPEAAHNAAHRSEIAMGYPLHPYICTCTWYHLSKQPQNNIPADATANTADVTRLQLQSHTTFRATVANEARGNGTIQDRLALRHRGLLERWQKALKELHADITTQLKQRANDNTLEAHDWRRRATSYRNTLTARSNECRDLLAQAVAKTNEEKTAEREAHNQAIRALQQKAQQANAARREARDNALDGHLDRAGIPRYEAKELRRQAGENAIQRLIDAHGLEFSRYLAEECEALGAPLPKRVERHLTDAA